MVIQGKVDILFAYLLIDAAAVFEGCSGVYLFITVHVYVCDSVCVFVCVGVQCGISAVAPGVDLR